MAQGPLKSSKASSKPKAKPSSKGITRKGTQNLAPKKSAALKRQKKLTHKFSSGMAEKTERMLGEKAGHLEMLGGGGKKAGKGKSIKGGRKS